MPIILGLSVLLQVSCIVHCMRTGRNTNWIYVLAILSYAGVLAYVAAELLPDILYGRTGRRAARNVKRVFDPTGDLRKYESEARFGQNVASRQRYADELSRLGRHEDAIAEYRKALNGLYEHDPNLMLGLARAQFAKGDPAATRATLDDLIRLNPDFKSADGHLLYAEALEAEGNLAKALDEYQALSGYYPGAEASVRYANLLLAQGREGEARQVAQELLDGARVAPSHYRRSQRSWLDQAKRILAGDQT
jgi:hypothetical protein